MTASQWPDGMDVAATLAFLQGKVSERKLRLFACACCRQIWHLMADERSRMSVEVAERYADGTAALSDLLGAHRGGGDVPDSDAARAAWWASDAATNAHEATRPCCDCALRAAVKERLARESARCAAPGVPAGNLWSSEVYDGAKSIEAGKQLMLLRDVVGDPFRPVAIGAACLAWREAVVVKLARAAYDDPEMPAGRLKPARLAVLADALEEAGCDNNDILSHLRGPGPHTLGCWVVDQILGKE